jgi:hypothetical protein
MMYGNSIARFKRISRNYRRHPLAFESCDFPKCHITRHSFDV